MQEKKWKGEKKKADYRGGRRKKISAKSKKESSGGV